MCRFLPFLLCDQLAGRCSQRAGSQGAARTPGPCSPDSRDCSHACATSAAPVTALSRGTVSEDRSVLCVRCPV